MKIAIKQKNFMLVLFAYIFFMIAMGLLSMNSFYFVDDVLQVDGAAMSAEPWQWILGGGAAILIGISKTGIPGVGPLVITMLATAFGGRPALGIMLTMLILADVFAVTWYRRHAQWGTLIKLFPWVALGMPVGVAALWLTGNVGAGKDVLAKTIGVVVLVTVIWSFPVPLYVTPEVRSVYDFVESLVPGEIILIGVDYDPAALAELHPMSYAITRQCFAKDVKLLLCCLHQNGPGMVEQVIAQVAEEYGKVNGVDYVYFGYQAYPAITIFTKGH